MEYANNKNHLNTETMILPVCLLFVIIATLFIFEPPYSKVNLPVILLIYISMTAICAFRDINMPDAENYINDFTGFMVNGRFEIGYRVIRDIARLIGDNYQILFLVVGAVALFIKFCAFVNIAPFIYGALLVYLSYFFTLHEMIQMRVGVAVGFMLFAIKYITERDLLKFLIFASIATLFHTSTLIIFPLWFTPKIQINKLIWISLIPLSYIAVTLLGLTAGKIISHIPIGQVQLLYNGYLHSMSQGGHNIINIFNLLLIGKVAVCSFLILFDDLIQEYFMPIKTWLMIYTLSLVIYIIFSDIPVVAIRVSELLQTVEVITIPSVVFTIKEQIIGKFIVIIISLIFLMGIIYVNGYLI
ncbi:MAG: EpsG family protein [Rikenellaceae bacterium]